MSAAKGTGKVIAVKRWVPTATPSTQSGRKNEGWSPSPTRHRPYVPNLETLLANLGSGGDPDDLHPDSASTAFATQREVNAQRDVEDVRDRVVFRKWPRDPKGESIIYTKGKMAPNGLPLWGATLYDFFFVHRFPDVRGSMTITTGSKLANWMIEHGETEYCQEELAWASREADPVEIEAPSMAELIEATEKRIRCGMAKSMPATNLLDMKDFNYFKPSPFDREHYPKRWPIYPFSGLTNALQQKLDLHVLPQKLIVHDPWRLLKGQDDNYHGEFVPKNKNDRLTPFPYAPTKPKESEESGEEEEEKERGDPRRGKDWTNQKDVVHTFTLELPESNRWKEEAKARADYIKTVRENQDESSKSFHGFMIRPTGTTPGPIEPPIFIVHDPPPPPRRIPVAHLYLDPSEYAGRGSRTKAYRAELELPRYAFFEDILCPKCINDEVVRILREEDGQNGETKNPQWKERSGKLTRVWESEPAIDVTIEPEQELSRYNELHERLKAIKSDKGKRKRSKKGDESARPFSINDMTKEEIEEEIAELESRFADQTYTIKDGGEPGWRMEYEGPVRPLRVKVKWQNPNCPDEPCCSHLKALSARKGAHPLTARVRVIAKMARSAENGYSSGEARKYLSLPDHFFRHYSGYNVVQPLHDPVPVTPVVPQFYGYYEPVMRPLEKFPSFLSSITLLEDCGRTLREVIHDPNVDARVGRCLDDRQELSSLVFRLHEAGFIHNNVHLANFLAQPGPLQEFPFFRKLGQINKRQWSFRVCGLRYLKDMLGDNIRKWQNQDEDEDKASKKEKEKETEEEKKAREEMETKRSEKIHTFKMERAKEENDVTKLLRILHMQTNWKWMDEEEDKRSRRYW